MDWGQDAFCFSTLDVADDNRAVFKYLPDEKETSQPPILQGLLLMFSNEDKNSAPSSYRKKDEATRIVSYSESDLFYRDLTTFVVQVRGGLIDSKVPGLRFDFGKREISVDWRNVYTSYFSQCLAGITQKEIVSICRIIARAAVFV